MKSELITNKYRTGKYFVTLDEKNRLVSLSLRPAGIAKSGDASAPDQSAIAKDIVAQLDEYYSGKRRVFDIRLAPAGTDFQKLVWRALCRIPYGATITYSGLAKATGKPRAVRAVANAVAKNPIGIIIPCHRVIASDGSLGGYSAGLGDGNPRNEKNLSVKKNLLDIEKKYRAE
ncbi:MAG: methylated-DNA--[protein]-cysteine S-methyltransferase [Spirochaetaceae bacterium]|nr:MAG: methylated-DNA--[protein]-cysteine S-methyltransferase [Spirochaetaceae bacterium]